MSEWFKQNWRGVVATAGGAVVALILVIVGCLLWGSSDSGASDPAVDVVDPVSEDAGVAAASLVAATNSYMPAEDASPADAAARVRGRLTGKYLKLANSAEGAPRPDQWEIWARNGDRIQAVAEPTREWREPPADVDSVAVPLNLTVFVWHADGDRTPLMANEVRAEMVREAGMWKLSDLEYVRSIP